ncbi:hypothetical protein M758_12G066500 [Ceratodon purpureus]|uniref:Secreted protein n=1 Tax=Ceratodon purpureus TaxID=3225 RepID=A0A8T0G4E4_CERPU|nr:hypothetical protein KC19_12G064600 [Ceratodon purpureus]KAG0598355.1 hypothetical protein M758_12G066500 [Ceratodon purpureus]
MNYVCLSTFQLLMFRGAYAHVSEDGCNCDFWPGTRDQMYVGLGTIIRATKAGDATFPSTGCCSWVVERKFLFLTFDFWRLENWSM